MEEVESHKQRSTNSLVEEGDLQKNPKLRIDVGWINTAEVNTINNSVLDQTRSGSQSTVTEVINNETLGDRIVSRELIHFIGNRNIEFTGKRLSHSLRCMDSSMV